MAHDRNLRVLAHVLHERSAAARDDEVDVLRDGLVRGKRNLSEVT